MGGVGIESVQAAVEGLRQKLIDTTKRNKLLNYRPSKTYGVEVVDENPASIWRILVLEGKAMAFTGPPDPPRRAQGEAEEDLLAEAGFFDSQPERVVVDTEDLKLNTNVTHTNLQNRLLHTWRQATSQLDEQGINTLFLALGMLQWKEADAADATFRAPLVLVPVVLERTNRDGFRLKYDENDIVTNLSLQVALVKQGVTLPSIGTDIPTFDFEEYCDEVGEAIGSKAGWSVRSQDVALGFFSFAKIVLYQDLENGRWPEDEGPASHGDVQAALGGGYGEELEFPELEGNLDEVRTPEESHEIFEADSSQIKAIVQALSGNSMVIEGPPGTGKSQTIANLIGEFVSQGKKVLFVSEKMAALEVVYRKLGDAGLQEACIEVHSQKANRRSFYDALQKTWQLMSSLPDAAAELERLGALRTRLNGFVQAIHEPLPLIGVSPRFLFSKACSLPPLQEFNLEAGFQGQTTNGLKWGELERLRPDIVAIEAKVRQIGVPSFHPFYGSDLMYLAPEDQLHLTRLTRSARALLATVTNEIDLLAKSLGVSNPPTLGQTASLNDCVAVASSAPRLDGIAANTGTWRVESHRIKSILSDVETYQLLRSTRASQVDPSAWEQDLGAVKIAYDLHAEKPFRFFSGDFRKAQALLSTYLTASAPREPWARKVLVKDLCTVRACRERVSAFSAAGERLFGVQWQGESSDPKKLGDLLAWIIDIEGKVEDGLIPKSLLALLSGDFDSADLTAKALALQANVTKLTKILADLHQSLRLVRLNDIVDLPLTDIEIQLDRFENSFGRLPEIVEWNVLTQELRDKGLDEVIEFATTWPHAHQHLESHVLRVWLQENIKKAFSARPQLRSFERVSHEEAIREFKLLDTTLQLHNRARVAHAHLRNIPRAGSVGLSADLARQCALRRGHRPIRWAYENFSELILRIKPVTMMSPISVATFLPLARGLFDVVIFDEASQVKPEDALSAIIRSKQVIVVGDTKQMPPTTFFDALAAEDEYGDEDTYDLAIGKLESVLALFSVPSELAGRKTALEWHYRSLHEALIQPSNRLFYDDGLIVFPSPVYAATDSSSDLGLRFHYDPSATYDRGSARKQNKKQAAAVADAIVQHLKDRPQESLLAVAFSKHQQEAIEDELELRQRDDPGLFNTFSQLHQFEPLKVKNLETVQGDERDVVFISVGYGRDDSGQLTMNFGPINQEGGGRRLNVLMSRARKRTEVFTSISGSDIRADDKKKGLQALKTYLQYAETGVLDVPTPDGRMPESIFEEQVKVALEQLGFEVDSQVGTVGFRIDLAVRHPSKAGTYTIGIECDGATYHSARSARDRDKLRESVLRARGWQLHRIWSTDWWRDKAGCLERCRLAIQRSLDLSVTSNDRDETPSPSPLTLWVDVAGTELKGDNYVQWTGTFDLRGYHPIDLPVDDMAACIRFVVAAEGPIHIDLLTKRVRTSSGYARAGNLIASAVQKGVIRALSKGQVEFRDQFLYLPEGPEIRARSRNDLENGERLVEYIAPEEMQDAIRRVLHKAVAADDAAICEGVRLLFGFGRTPTALFEAVSSALKSMVAAGSLTDNGLYRLASLD